MIGGEPRAEPWAKYVCWEAVFFFAGGHAGQAGCGCFFSFDILVVTGTLRYYVKRIEKHKIGK
jgi:hypothetical protein